MARACHLILAVGLWSFVCQADGTGEGTQGSAMLQYPGVWMAGPFGKCSSGCKPAVKERPVVCRDFWHGNETLPCIGLAPVTTVECFCELEACDETPLSNCSATSGEGSALPVVMPTGHFTFVGCFGLAAGDSGAAGEFEDYTCMNFSDSGSGKCRSGLPFFTNSTATTPEDCSEFCLGKGLDIFALVSDSACRCGASAINAGVWHGDDAPAHLLFDAGSIEEDDESDICPLKVYRYTGYYDLGGVPLSLLKTSVSTTAYIDGLVAGRFIAPREEEERPTVAEAELLQNPSPAPTGPWDGKACYPESCGGRGYLWKVRKAWGHSNESKYETYTWVPYYYTDKIDSTRKQVWETAVKTWRENTCAVLHEVSSRPDEGLTVDVVDKKMCYVNFLEGSGKKTVNLGWCKDNRHLGNVIHEIGHALGMLHEQQRMDATQEYHGKGPYLTMHWENIPSNYVWQYLPQEKEYMGSGDDGPGDPHVGYAPYDFESIMHYHAGDAFSTIPSYQKQYAGQRARLAGSDIMQINDMHQCILKPGFTAPPTPAPSTIITISGACPQHGWSMNGDYEAQGVTSSGAIWYKMKGKLSLYFDSSCNSVTNLPRWILDDDDPNPSAQNDLDGDGNCVYWAGVAVSSTKLTYPASGLWTMWCPSMERYAWGWGKWLRLALKIGSQQ